MRGLRAGVLATAVCVVGCKDNPGFALIPDGPEATETSSADGATTEPPVASTTLEPDATTLTPTATTSDEPTLTSGTTDPLPACGDGFVDMNLGEQCDDANDVDLDGCTGECRRSFVAREPVEFGGSCLGVIAEPIDENDELADLVLVSNSGTALPALENAGDGSFLAMGHDFATGQNAVLVAVARDLDGKHGKDIVAMSNALPVCVNDPGEKYCDSAVEYALPMTLLGFVPPYLEVADIDDDAKVDAVTVAKFGEVLAIQAGVGGGVLDMGDPKTLMFPKAIADGTLRAIDVGDFTGAVELPDLAVGFEAGGGHVMLFTDFGVMNALPDTGAFLVGESVSSLVITNLGVGGPLGDVVVADPAGGRLRFLSDVDGGEELALADAFVPILADEKKVIAADLRGGGQSDLLTVEVDGNFVHVVPVPGDQLPVKSYAVPTDIGGLVDAAVADLDGDGDGDIVVVNAACAYQVLLNQLVANP